MLLTKRSAAGFTLIEIMVAMSIFAIVALVSVSALIMANRVNQKAQALKVATDSLHFALSSLTFKLRQGKNYCRVTGNVSSLNPTLVNLSDASCSGSGPGAALVFLTPKWATASDPTKRVAYRLNNNKLEYWEPGNGWLVVTVNNLVINDLGFSVDSSVVPRAFISMRGTASSSRETANFEVETLVSERL